LKSVWLLEKIYGTAALAAISPLLKAEEDVDTRTQATHVMAHFLRHEGPAEGDTIRVPAAHVQQPVLYAMQQCTDVLHDLLDVLPIAEQPALDCLDAFTNYQKPREILAAILGEGRSSVGPEHEGRVNAMLAKTGD